MDLTEKGASYSALFCVVSAFEYALTRPSIIEMMLKNGYIAREGVGLQGNR